MKLSDTVRLLGVIAQLWPSMKINEFTAEAWHPALADIAAEDALTAVYSLIKSHPGYIGIYDIRRQAAKEAGLLAIDEGSAYDMAAAVGLNQGIGARMLPGAVQDAYWQMGGSQAFEDPRTVVRARWNKTYAGCVEAAERQLLVGDLGKAIDNARRAAQIDAPERRAVEGD